MNTSDIPRSKSRRQRPLYSSQTGHATIVHGLDQLSFESQPIFSIIACLALNILGREQRAAWIQTYTRLLCRHATKKEEFHLFTGISENSCVFEFVVDSVA